MAGQTRGLPPTLNPLAQRAFDLFDWLSRQTLPTLVVREENVDLLRMLVAAGFIKADIPGSRVDRHENMVQPPATVTELTSDGHRWRERNLDHPRSKLGKSLTKRLNRG